MYKHLFGPVPSRRLGISLGIDLIPKKVCTLNCVYCEVGETKKRTTERLEYVKYDKVIGELQDFMSQKPHIDFITFSGSGEPTLNSKIGEVLRFIKKEYPNVKTAILTNGTLLSDSALRSEIIIADVLLPSLDAASQKVFERIDRPHPSLKVEEYIQGLVDLRKEFKGEIWLEILFLKGYNDSKEELSLLKEALIKIKADRIQLNTLDRPGTLDGLEALSQTELKNIITFWNLPMAEIIANPPNRKSIESFQGDIEDAILKTIARRPCTLDDLHHLLGLHINEINKYLSTLESQNKIEAQNLSRGIFYELKDKNNDTTTD